MSFLSKLVKKVFKFHKRLLKKTASVVKRAFKSKWFKYAVMIGVTLFTAGLGAGGWAAFSQSAFGNGIGGFFSAVGSTISAGFTSITSSIGGLFTGGAEGSISAGGVELVNTGLNKALTTGLQTIQANAAKFGTDAVVGKAVQTAGKGLISRVASAFLSPGPGGEFLRGAAIAGFKAYSDRENLKDERRREDQAVIFGGPRRGGSAELPPGTIRPPILPGAFAEATPPTPQQLISSDPSAGQFSSESSRATQISSLPGVQQPILGIT